MGFLLLSFFQMLWPVAVEPVFGHQHPPLPPPLASGVSYVFEVIFLQYGEI